MKNYIYRVKVEQNDEWRKWSQEIPTINFPSNWNVRIIPPISGAIIRFLIIDSEKDKKISIYLDCYDRLGIVGEPYWEIYPYADDIYRIKMADTKQLIQRIQEVLDDKDSYEK